MYNNYQSVRKMTLDEYLEEMKYLRNKHPKKKISRRKYHWIYLIKNNMLECVATKKLVSYCSYDYNPSSQTHHYNFYSEDGDLFTIDHKIPISKGGSRGRVDNIQPMLSEPNHEKGSDLKYT